MQFGFIGAGQVGSSLGKYFSEKGLIVSGYYSKSLQSAQEAARFTKTQVFSTVAELVSNSDVIFITVPDDIIPSIWKKLSKLKLKDKLICHASGSLTSAIFVGISKLGAFGYSVHPMFPFADKWGDYQALDKVYFSIEGDASKLDFWKDLFRALGNRILLLQQSDKPRYHLANVMVSNLVLGLINKGIANLSACGLIKTDAMEALLPLICSNIANLHNSGLVKALTGPVERGDSGTIEKHLNCLSEEDSKLYKNLSRELLDLAQDKHPERDYTRLIKILEEE